jgi:hypothetical protein
MPLAPGAGDRDASHMKSWFAPRGDPLPGRTDDELPGRVSPIAPSSRACCCPAMPVVTVILPPTAARRHPVDLLLCGHHYRASQAALRAAGATVYDSTGAVVTPGPGWESAVWEPAAAGRRQVTR